MVAGTAATSSLTQSRPKQGEFTQHLTNELYKTYTATFTTRTPGAESEIAQVHTALEKDFLAWTFPRMDQLKNAKVSEIPQPQSAQQRGETKPLLLFSLQDGRNLLFNPHTKPGETPWNEIATNHGETVVARARCSMDFDGAKYGGFPYYHGNALKDFGGDATNWPGELAQAIRTDFGGQPNAESTKKRIRVLIDQGLLTFPSGAAKQKVLDALDGKPLQSAWSAKPQYVAQSSSKPFLG